MSLYLVSECILDDIADLSTEQIVQPRHATVKLKVYITDRGRTVRSGYTGAAIVVFTC